jgi:predicted transcriptional regulator
MENTPDSPTLLALTVEIVASFVSNNSVAAGDLPALIKSVFASLSSVGQIEVTQGPETLTPAVPIRKSIGTDFIVCLEDGKKLKMLKRHLAIRYNMTPAEYRSRWGLPADYPMVAPAYAELRSTLAKQIDFRRKPASAPVPAAPEPESAVAQRPAVPVGGRRKSA